MTYEEACKLQIGQEVMLKVVVKNTDNDTALPVQISFGGYQVWVSADKVLHNQTSIDEILNLTELANEAQALALIGAANNKSAGMEALNQQRLSLGQSIGYDDEAFFKVSMELKHIAKLCEGLYK